ncbi:MAG: hypothetical protein ACK2U9_10855, partial [Anaerolineae bacterium]
CHLAASLALQDRREEAGVLLGQLGRLDRPADRAAAPSARDAQTNEIAMRLATWLLIDPRHPEVAWLVQRLTDSQVESGHYTTRRNAMVLLALGQYSRFVREEDPTFGATVRWRAGGPVHTFDNTTPVTYKPGPEDAVEIVNQGPGALYYYDRIQGVPLNASDPESDDGIEVRRTFRRPDGTPLATPRLRQGELVIVDIAIGGVDRAALEDLVIEDLLPAGLEVENPRLKTSTQMPWIAAKDLLALRHEDIRDDRVLLFPSPVQGARHHYYAARAVTPGTYVVPAITAEGMYEPALRSIRGAGTLEVIP